MGKPSRISLARKTLQSKLDGLAADHDKALADLEIQFQIKRELLTECIAELDESKEEEETSNGN
jgi:hypothetical protein